MRRSVSSEGQRAGGPEEVRARNTNGTYIFGRTLAPSLSRWRAATPALPSYVLFICFHIFMFSSRKRAQSQWSEWTCICKKTHDDFRVCDLMNSKVHAACVHANSALHTHCVYEHTSKKERNNDDDDDNEEKKSKFVSLLRHSSLIKYAVCASVCECAGARLSVVYKATE